MTISDFFATVNADPDLTGIDMAHDTVTVKDEAGYYTTFHACVILELPWATLREYAVGTKMLEPLYHVTRVVGYFSRIENWNKSRLAELKDRRKGNYEVPADIQLGKGGPLQLVDSP